MIKPFPKPSIQHPTPKRLPERKAVTIIAGFKSYEGIVLMADTQETVSNISKRNIPKLRFEPSGGPHEGDNLAAAFCGAGDNGPFIDKLVETAWEDAQLATSLDEACEEIEKSIKRVYREFGQIYQVGYCPSAELIYGVKMHSQCRLFSAHGAIITKKETYDSWGAGYYMADFLANRMYRDYLNLRQCAILAAYILYQAKEHVDGCGGDSHIAVLRENGVSGIADWQHVEAITKMLGFADHDMGTLLLNCADLDMEPAEFIKEANDRIEILDALRTASKEELARNELQPISMLSILGVKKKQPKDFLGLPMPSASQTSKDQQ